MNNFYTDKEMDMLFHLIVTYATKEYITHIEHQTEHDEFFEKLTDSNKYWIFFSETLGTNCDVKSTILKLHLRAEHFKIDMKLLTKEEFITRYPWFKELYPIPNDSVNTQYFAEYLSDSFKYIEDTLLGVQKETNNG